MDLEKRLDRVEEKLIDKCRPDLPSTITLCKDDNQEQVLERLRDKFGQDFTPRIVLIMPYTREEAVKMGRTPTFYSI